MPSICSPPPAATQPDLGANQEGARAEELERDYAAERLADYIKRTVDEAPPLTPAQRDRLAMLLRGGPDA